MPTKTYVPISTTTFSTNTTSLTFNSIPSTYTDLVIIIRGKFSSDVSGGLTFNSDTGANYSRVRFYSSGTSATTNSSTSGTQMAFTTGNGAAESTYIINIQNYSNTNRYKSVIQKGTQDYVSISGGVWLSNSAISSINITANSGGTFVSGTTLTLYGIH